MTDGESSIDIRSRDGRVNCLVVDINEIALNASTFSMPEFDYSINVDHGSVIMLQLLGFKCSPLAKESKILGVVALRASLKVKRVPHLSKVH